MYEPCEPPSHTPVEVSPTVFRGLLAALTSMVAAPIALYLLGCSLLAALLWGLLVSNVAFMLTVCAIGFAPSLRQSLTKLASGPSAISERPSGC